MVLPLPRVCLETGRLPTRSDLDDTRPASALAVTASYATERRFAYESPDAGQTRLKRQTSQTGS